MPTSSAFRGRKADFRSIQNLLELENDRREAKKRLAAMPDEDTIRKEMVDFILTKKAVPTALQTHHGRAAISGIA